MACPAFSQCIPQGTSQMIQQPGREKEDLPLSIASLRTNVHSSTFLQVSSDRAGDDFTSYLDQQFNFAQLAVTSSIYIHILLNAPITNIFNTGHSINVKDKVSLLRKMARVIRFFLCVLR
jgi:hypothetical protein